MVKDEVFLETYSSIFCQFSILPMVGEVAAILTGHLGDVALGVIHGVQPKAFQGFF